MRILGLALLITIATSCASQKAELHRRDMETCMFSAIPLLQEMGVNPTERQMIMYCNMILNAKQLSDQKEDLNLQYIEPGDSTLQI